MDALQPAPIDLPSPYVPSNGGGIQHRILLSDQQHQQWGKLVLRSWARSANSTPLFYEGATIYGSIEIAAHRDLRSVTIKATSSIEAGTMIVDNLYILESFRLSVEPQDCAPRFWRLCLAVLDSHSQRHPCPKRQTRVTVLYELAVTVSRGVFRPDRFFKIRFKYVPCTRPDAPSALRQRAYEPLLGPGAWTLHLRRCVRYESTSSLARQTSEGEETVTLVAPAAWWPCPSGGQDPYIRTLQGEIRIPAEAVSSSSMATYSLSYTVDLSPPNGVGFTPQNNNVLLSIPALVATEYAANSPRSVLYAPPSYETFVPPELSQSQMPAYLHMYGRGANSSAW
ncbi:hypothetical protein R3P38DRAFT_3220534 [Favolaschia claudopus]|uniref:Arrestin-like N-terminal domain-containing protein n=1 Tax=Favolaschia claudopus TaxID=2862362 RepID=A0AAW0A2C1_9AGAR